MGVTNLVCAASVTGDTPAIAVGNGTTRSDLSLASNTALGNNSITLSPANAVTFSSPIQAMDHDRAG
jgi:hypothetical protein